MADHKVDSFIVELGFSEKVIKGLERVEKAAMQSATRIERRLNKSFEIKPNKSHQEALNRIVKNAQSASGKINKALNSSLKFDSQGAKSLKRLETQGKKTAKEINKALREAMKVDGKISIRGGKGRKGAPEPEGLGIPRPTRPQRQDILQRQMERMFNNNMYSGLTRKLETMGGQGRGMADNFRGNLQNLYNKYKGSGKVGEYELEVKKLIDTTKRWVIAENARLRTVKESQWLQERANASLKQMVGGFASAYAALELAKSSIEAGIKRQSVQLASTAIFGSDTQQARMFAATFSHQVGQNYSDTMKQYSDFAAGAQPALGFQGTQDFYKNAAMFARIRGASDDDLKGIMVAFQQMASKGKVQAEELRGQLGDRLAGAVQLFGDAIGKTPKELDKLMQDGKLLSSEVLPKVSERMAELVQQAGGLDAVAGQTATSMGQAKAQWENMLVALFNNSNEGITQLSRSSAMFLQGSMGTAEMLSSAFNEILLGASNMLDTVTDIMYRISGTYYGILAWYTDLDKGQQDLIKHSADFLGNVVAIGGAIAVVTRAVKFLGSIVSGSIFTKLLSKAGIKVGEVAAAGEEAAAVAGVSALRMATGVAGLSLSATRSSDPNAQRNYNPVTANNPFKDAVSDITNPQHPLFFDQNGQAQFGKYTLNQDGSVNLDKSESNWDILLAKFGETIEAFGNKVNTMPMMMTPSGMPIQTKQTLNVSFNLDGKQIATKMVDITDKNQEDILLNSSYPEDE